MFKNFYLIATLSFLSGLILAFNFVNPENHPFSLISPYFYFSLGLFSLLLSFKSKKPIFLIIFFFFLALWRYQLIFPSSPLGRIENHLGEDISLFTKNIAETELKNNKQKLKLKIICAQDERGEIFKLKGKILVTTLAYPFYNYNDFLKIKGTYLRPGKISEFDYDLYLKRWGIRALSYYPQVSQVEIGENPCSLKENFLNRLGSALKKKIFHFKKEIKKQEEANLSNSSAAILKAMLLGDKSGLDDDLLRKFSQAGLSHVIAISGMHISLLSSLFLNFLLFLGVSRKKSFYFSVFFLLFYLILIGAPASACRASLMGFWSLLAVYTGRLGNLPQALYLTALTLLLINPLLLFADLGFQLSFLAVLGIIYLYPNIKLLSEILIKRLGVFQKIKFLPALIDILSLTIAVQLIAAPVLISSFKQFSLIAPLSNLLVVPLLPAILSLAILSLPVSYLLPFLGQALYLLIDLLLKYLVAVSSLSDQIPKAFININNWSFFLSLGYYFFLYQFFIKKNNWLLGKIKNRAKD